MIQIRPATTSDHPELSRIFHSVRRDTFDWCDPVSFALEDFAAQTMGEKVYLAYDVDAGIVGFVSVWEKDSFVHHLYVSKEWQRKGIGQLLLQSLHSWLPRPYRLKCLTANSAALDFYLKQGWEEIATGSDPLGSYVLMEFR